MANADTPFGLKPVFYKNGAPWNGKATRYYVPSTDGTALYIGDPVNLAGSADAEGVPTVTRATLADGNATLGPVVAVEPETNASTIYRVASTARYVYVADDPNLVFEAQVDSDSTIAATSIGLNAIGVLTHSGSTVTGLSGMEIDGGVGTSPSADASNMFVIIGAPRRPDNTLTEACVKVYVMIAMHKFKATGDGDGILGV